MEQVSKYIYEIICEKVNSMDRNGLFLLDLQTGIGKTYNIIQYIKNHYKERKIFFVSNQLKLLPQVDEFIRGLNDDQVYDVKNNYLRLNSLMEAFVHYPSEEHIESKIINKLHFEKIMSIIENHKRATDDIAKNYFQDLFYKEESEFRQNIKNKLREEEDKFDEDECEVEKTWINKLYPGSLIFDKNIIMLSTKRFFYPIDTIFNGSISLYDNKEFEEAIIIFDEIDKVKEELLSFICDNGSSRKIDCFKLFRKVMQCSLNCNINKNTLFDSVIDYAQKTEEYKMKFDKCFDKLKGLYHVNFDLLERIKLPFVNDEDKVNRFLFKDEKTITIHTEYDKKYIQYKSIGTSLNNQVFFEEKLNDEYCCLNDEIDDVIKVINKFVYIIKDLSTIYFKYRNEYSKNKITLNNAINSIMDRIDLGSEYKHFILAKIQTIPLIKRDSFIGDFGLYRDRRKTQYDFYYDGFSFINLVNTDSEQLETKIYLNMFNTTPEMMLMSITKNNIVVGVSATATINTPLKNFDTRFLQFLLDDRLLLLSPKEKERLNFLYNESNPKYDCVVDVVKENVECWKNSNESIYKLIEEKNIPNYRIIDIINIIEEYNKFMERPDHSFIFFLPYNISVNIMSFIKEIININCDTFFMTYDGNTFKDSRFESLHNSNMMKYKKVFIISSYQTIGTGVNLHYNIPNFISENELICTINRGKKDFDGCFLSKVTNVFPGYDDKTEDYSKSLFAIMYLRASDKLEKHLSKRIIKELFFNKKILSLSQKEYKSVNFGVASVLIQAIGRICRTKVKLKQVYIGISDDCMKHLKSIKHELLTINLNKEFICVLEKITSHKDLSMNKKVDSANIAFNTFLRNNLKFPFNIERKNNWVELRDFVLKYPTANLFDFSNKEDFKDLYVYYNEEINEYSVDRYNFTKNIDWEFSKNTNHLSSKRYEISGFACGLLSFINSDINIANYFIDKGYATKFELNNFNMGPNLFKSIYKGALGEVCGEYILHKFDIPIIPIVDTKLYELFDFTAYGIYFDMKHWSRNYEILEEDIISNINRKMSNVNVKKAYYINVFYEGYESKSPEGDVLMSNGKEVVQIPWIYNPVSKKYNEIALLSLKAEVDNFKKMN